jgi:hypothetical protein
MKKLIAIFVLFSIASCSSNWAQEEAKHSAKSGAASARINASKSNADDVFKDVE